MPRPGPRPYECVRRAWHSDRHQPIRGSLIQEIFRVVHEIHKPATKKNKEWQEKLPVVVLKAEEIMYSKANSEAEYMDLKTLWDRTYDAINTIIRLDGTTETGVFLQPCIEAALHLGCTPRRASRSQRNMSPSYYLSPISPCPMSVTSSSLRNTTQENHRTTNQFMSSYSDSRKTSFSCLGKASQIPAVYPLYYGDLKSKESKFTFDIPPKLSSHSMELSEMGVKPNIYCKLDALNKTTQDVRNAFENSHENGCDLSLRLGCLGGPCAIIENSVIKDLEHVGSKTLQVGNKLVDSSIQIDKSFFNKSYICDAVDTCSTDWVSETEKFNLRTILRKRKAVFDHLCEDKQLSRHPKLTFHDSTERTHNAAVPIFSCSGNRINVQKSELVSFKIIENMETVASEERDEMDGDDSEDEVLKLNSIRKRRRRE